MNDKIKIGLLAVIAVAMIAIAIKGLPGKATAGDGPDSAVAANNANALKASDAKTFDPLAAENTAETSAIDNMPKTTVNFNTYDHDFGNIKQDSENKYIFTFTNTGKEPMIIESAKGSCGCTVPNYPKEPVAPGATGEIEVVYKPGKQKDLQNKTVTVVSNTEPKQTTLRIKATVEELPGNAAATPAS